MTTADPQGSPPRSLPPPLAQAAAHLSNLAAQSALVAQDSERAATSARALANGLQTHALRSALGSETDAISSVGTLMAKALEGSNVAVQTELCRVVGNACFDHDENRQLVLDAGIPLLISKIIASVTTPGSSETDMPRADHRRTLTLAELKMLRACVGAILNSSLKFDPVRKELGRDAILRSLLSLIDNRPDSPTTRPVYYVGMHACRTGETEEDWYERLELGETIAGWTMNVLEDVLSEDNTRFPSEDGVPILASILLCVPLPRASPAPDAGEPLPPLTGLAIAPTTDDEEESHLDTDIELLSISAALLEGLTLDHDVHKQTIALSAYESESSPQPRSLLLFRLLEFIEIASPPEAWARDEEEQKRLKKTFEVVKAATIRAVVEGTNDDRVMNELWKLSAGEGGRNWLVEKLVGWLEQEKERSAVGTREDLVVCASHMLAGMGRSDHYVETLVHEYGLAAPLAKIIESRVPAALVPVTSTTSEGGQQGASRAGENTQVLYGAISLMRHLAIPLKNRPLISATHLISTISLLLSPSMDIVKPLQMSVVGLLKHLTTLNVASSLDVLAREQDPISSVAGDATRGETPVDLLLALIKRTDELQLRSESTRVLANVVRSLFADSSSPDEGAVRVARQLVLEDDRIVEAISEQVRLSEKYPILVNEGIVALSLLSGGAGGERGASSVLSALLHRKVPVASDPPFASITETGTDEPPTTTPVAPPTASTLSPTLSKESATSLDTLRTYLSSVATAPAEAGEGGGGGSATLRPEIVSNVCTLLITVLKNSGSDCSAEKQRLCEELTETVKGAAHEVEGSSGTEWNSVKEGVKVLGRVVEETMSRA